MAPAKRAQLSPEEGRKKAMAACQAMFDRYHALAKERPDHHVVCWNFLYVPAPKRRKGEMGREEVRLRDKLLIGPTQDFDRQVMKDLKIIDATMDGTVTFELYISPGYSNLNGKSLSSSPIPPSNNL